MKYRYKAGLLFLIIHLVLSIVAIICTPHWNIEEINLFLFPNIFIFFVFSYLDIYFFDPLNIINLFIYISVFWFVIGFIIGLIIEKIEKFINIRNKSESKVDFLTIIFYIFFIITLLSLFGVFILFFEVGIMT